MMQVTNVSNRGWLVAGAMISPGATAEVNVTKADLEGNTDLVIESEEVFEFVQTAKAVIKK